MNRYIQSNRTGENKTPNEILKQMVDGSIGGFNQRRKEALPPQIFLTLKFVVCIALKIIEIVAT